MAIEQERRFLVRGAFPKTDGVAISQGYLSTVKERTVRVRTKGDKAFITVKGETDSAGKRLEFEYEIPLTDAREMLDICAPYPIEKTRYHVNDSGFWLIKEFFNMTGPQTLKTWTVTETIIGVAGLGFTLLLGLFL